VTADPWNADWSKVDSIDGWLSEVEARELYNLAHAPGTIVVVEVGSFLGRSTAALALGIRAGEHGGKVYAVDTWEGDPDGSRERFAKLGMDPMLAHWNNMVRVEAAPFVEQCRGLSTDWASRWDYYSLIDVLFIDGHHAYESVKADVEAWLSHVKRGGVVAFHDEWAPGPSQVIRELPAHVKRIRVVDSLAVCAVDP